MANTRTFQRSFAGGEIAPEMLGRVGDPRYQSGAARLRNFISTPQGVARRRPGTAYVATTYLSGREVLVPFRYSVTDALVLGMGVGYFRFYKNGEPILYADPRVVASVSAAADTATFSEAHGFADNEQIRITITSGGAPPGGLDVGVRYYVLLVSPTVIQFRATNGGAALPISSSHTGTMRVFEHDELPTEWVSSKVFTRSSNNIVFGVPHGYLGGENITFTLDSGSALPAPLAVGTRYETVYVDSTNLTLLDEAGAAVTLTTAGTGTFRAHRDYDLGDLVQYSISGGASAPFYCRLASPVDGNDPTASAHWWQMTGDGVYAVPNSYTSDELPAVSYVQSNDVMKFAHPDHELLELRRYGTLDWEVEEIASFAPTIDAPVLGTPTRVYGQTIAMETNNGTGTWNRIITPVAGGSVPHHLATGDAFYLSANEDGTGTVGGIAAGLYIAEVASTSALFVLNKSGGTRVTFAAGPTSCYIRPTSLSADEREYYKVSSVTNEGVESLPTNSLQVDNQLVVSGSSNQIIWTAATGADQYRVYKSKTGIFGFIGDTENTSFLDENIGPDLSITPVIADTSLDGDDNPSVLAYFEQRLCLANQQTLWMTRTGTERDLSYHLPVIDTDRIKFTLQARDVATVRHIVPMDNLVILTDSTEFVVTPVNNDAITPDSFRARPVSFVGANTVRPVVVNNSLVFCAARGGHVREFGRVAQEGYATGDLSLRAAHLFDGLSIVSMAHQKAPFSVVWCVSSDGTLLGLTYVPEEEVGGWHVHETDGLFKSVCVIPEGDEDRVYFEVERTIDSSTVRYIERLGSLADATLTNSYHVDAGITYSGSSATAITGLDHLEGETVAILAGGTIRPTAAVASGSITLSTAATVAHIGLPFDSELRTLPVAFQIDGAFGQGRTKGVNKLWLRVVNSCRFEAGPSETELADTTDIAANTLIEEQEIDVHIPSDWTDGGQVWIKQTDPVPLSIVSLVAEVSIGS